MARPLKTARGATKVTLSASREDLDEIRSYALWRSVQEGRRVGQLEALLLAARESPSWAVFSKGRR